jgi:hypothetical protein
MCWVPNNFEPQLEKVCTTPSPFERTNYELLIDDFIIDVDINKFKTCGFMMQPISVDSELDLDLMVIAPVLRWYSTERTSSRNFLKRFT